MTQIDWVSAHRQRRPKRVLTDTPRARESDPSTSHEAGVRIGRSGVLGLQQLQVLAYVRLWPGLTSAELAAKVAERTRQEPEAFRWMIARRLPELRPVWVVNGAARLCAATGNKAMTWMPVEPMQKVA